MQFLSLRRNLAVFFSVASLATPRAVLAFPNSSRRDTQRMADSYAKNWANNDWDPDAPASVPTPPAPEPAPTTVTAPDESFARNWQNNDAEAMAQQAPAAEQPASTQAISPFHIAFPVRNVEEARDFYGRVLGCPEGRSANTWVDFSLYGHQIVAHLVQGYNAASSANAVDGDAVPVPHFGVVLNIAQFHELSARLKTAGIKFEIEPHLRFVGAPGEQWTMFFKDPSGNSLEFKAMTTPANLFAKYKVDT